MKKILSMVLMMLFGMTAFAQNLKNDPAHSRIQFTVTHLGINEITGYFKTAALDIAKDPQNFLKSTVRFSADINSIDTSVEARDNHLKSADFFDASTYPTMNFISTSLAKTKTKNVYVLKGNLTMHGVTKPVTVNLIYKGSTMNPMNKKQTYGYQVTGSIKRSAFGIGSKFPEAIISDNVKIKGDFELVAE